MPCHLLYHVSWPAPNHVLPLLTLNDLARIFVGLEVRLTDQSWLQLALLQGSASALAVVDHLHRTDLTVALMFTEMLLLL